MQNKAQITQPFSERIYDNPHLIDRLRDGKTRIDDELNNNKVVFLKSKSKRKALSDSQQLKSFNEVTATRLLAKRFAVAFNEENYQKCIREVQYALLGLSVFLVITSLSWITISNTNFLTNSDFSYNAGLFGGFLMLCSIFYALLKRIKFINALGHNETWFYAHLACGVVGSMVIFFHTTFQIKSLNSGIALTCLIIVMISGLFGRYICTLLSFQAQKYYDRIGEHEIKVVNTFGKYQQTTSKSVKVRLSKFLSTGMAQNKRWKDYFILWFQVPHRAMLFYLTLSKNIKQLYQSVAADKLWNHAEMQTKIIEGKQIARRYTKDIILLTAMQNVSDVLTHWRTFHSTILYLLTLTALGHILAVHMY